MRLLFAFFDLDALVLWSNCGDHDWSRSRFRASTRTPGPRPRVKAEPFRCRLRPRTRMLRSAGMALRAVSFLRPDWGLPSKGFGPRVPLRSTHGLLSCAASRLNIRTGSTGLWREPARFLVALLTCRPVTCVRALNLGGPSGPIVPTNDSSPNGSPQRGALQTFLQTWKSGSSSLAPQPAPRTPLAYGARNRPTLLPEVRLRGITHKSGEQLALSRPRNCRVDPVDIPAGLFLLYTMCQAGSGTFPIISVISMKTPDFREWS